MARMYPNELPDRVRQDPKRSAEVRVFDSLKRSLDDDWVVLYAVEWRYPDQRFRMQKGEADFVVGHAGLGWAVIEVKGGGVGHDPATGTWYSIDRDQKCNNLKRPPLQQADDSARALLLLVQAKRPKVARPGFPWTTGVWLPDVTEVPDWLGADVPTHTVATSLDVGQPEPFLRRLLGKQSGRLTMPAEAAQDVLETFVEYLVPKFEIGPDLASQIAEGERKIAQLTEEQNDVLDGLAGQRRVLVTGGAGTGKTMLAVEAAVRSVADGSRTLLCCFNKSLGGHLEETILAALDSRGVDAATAAERLTCTHLHSFAMKALTAAGIQANSNARGFWDEELPGLFEEALGELPELRFDTIVIDESQDFQVLLWEVVEQLLADPAAGAMWVFGDDNQNIYGGAHNVRDAIRAKGNFCLTKNLRNTKQIHGFVAPFYEGGLLRAGGPDGPDVQRVTLAKGADLNQEVAEILDRLTKDEHIRPGDIAVLSGGRHGSAVVGRKLGSHRPCTAKARKPNKVLADTIHSFKGLERPVVVLVELDLAFEDKVRELTYVGASRARDLLIVVESDED